VSVLTARRAIAAGEEVFSCYVPRAWPKSARREALRETYGFDCDCPRCMSLVEDTVVLKCSACQSTGSGAGGGGATNGCGGRVFWPDAANAHGVCTDCSKRVPLPATAAPGVPLDVADAPEAAPASVLERVCDELLSHPTLAIGDARVFGALSLLLDASSTLEAAGGPDSATAGRVAARAAHALEAAARTSAFTTVGELGFDVVDS